MIRKFTFVTKLLLVSEILKFGVACVSEQGLQHSLDRFTTTFD